MDIHAKLASLNLELPKAPSPVAAYVPAVRTGNLVFVSGQGPSRDGQMIATGKVGDTVSLELGQQSAQQCALNGLAVLGNAIDNDWSRFVRIVHLRVFIASAPDFYDQPKVANGASELMEKLFGDVGRHARAALGTSVLPQNITTEVEMVAEVR